MNKDGKTNVFERACHGILHSVSVCVMETKIERIRHIDYGRDWFYPLAAECRLVAVNYILGPTEREKLAELLRDRPDVTLRFTLRAASDLEVLKSLPWLRNLSLSLWELKDISGFKYVQNSLDYLHFGKTRKRFSLRFLDGMPNLKFLSLDGHTKDIASVIGLGQLKGLALRSVTLSSLSQLGFINQVSSLSIALGGTINLNYLAMMRHLEDLHLFRIANLDNLTVLKDIQSIKALSLDSLRNVSNLPSFSTLARLEEVTLDTMNGLTDLSPIAAAPALRRLTIYGMRQLAADDFRCFKDHPALEELIIQSNLGGVNVKKTVINAVKKMLPVVMGQASG